MNRRAQPYPPPRQASMGTNNPAVSHIVERLPIPCPTPRVCPAQKKRRDILISHSLRYAARLETIIEVRVDGNKDPDRPRR